jgi:prevent-host-death family protein
MKQLSLTEARARLSSLVAEVDKGKGPIAIAQRSKVKAMLVDPEWHGRVEEELAHYRSRSRRSPLKLRGSMTLTGELDEALKDLKKEREQSLERVIAGLKLFTSAIRTRWFSGHQTAKDGWENEHGEFCRRRSRPNTPSSCQLSFLKKSTDSWKENSFGWTCRFVAGQTISNVRQTFRSRRVHWESSRIGIAGCDP